MKTADERRQALFIKMPRFVMVTPGMTASILATYVAARSFTSRATKGVTHCWPGILKISGVLGQSKATVERNLDWLKGKGLIGRRRRFARSTKLSFTDHAVPLTHDVNEKPAITSPMRETQATVPLTGETRSPHPCDLEVEPRRRSSSITPPSPPRAALDGFDTFWRAYPKKVAKKAAEKAWKTLKPDPELQAQILAALEVHKQTDQWLKGGMQFIAYPASWIRGKRWEDELPNKPERDSDPWERERDIGKSDVDWSSPEANKGRVTH